MINKIIIYALFISLIGCSNNNRDGLFNRLGRSIASSDSIESQMASVRSIVQEINVNGTKILHVYNYPRPVFNATFSDNQRLQTLRKKLKIIRKQLLEDTSKNSPLTSEGKKLLNLMIDYLQATVTLHKFYALVAHTPKIAGVINPMSNYDWKNLDDLSLLVDKKYALLLLAKINFMARHMTEAEIVALELDPNKIKEGVEIEVGSEVKQMLEHLALNNPDYAYQYGQLLKFNAVRETLINTWGINRIVTTPHDPKSTSSYTKTLLTFRPGDNGSFLSNSYYKELTQSDDYYNNYVPILMDVVKATISTAKSRMNIASNTEYAEIYQTLIWGYPINSETKTIKPFEPVANFFLGKGKYEGAEPWTLDYVQQMFTGQEVAEVEEADYVNERLAYLLYTNFVGDKLDAEVTAESMAEKAWLARSTAVVTQIRHRIQNADMDQLEVTQLTNKIWQIVGRWKDRYKTHLKSAIKPMLEKHLNAKTMKTNKINAKYSLIKNAAKMTEGIKGAYVKEALKNDKLTFKHKMKVRTPETLVNLTQHMLQVTNNDAILFALEDNAEIAKTVKQFYTDLSNNFYKQAKENDSLDSLSQKLWDEAHKLAHTYKKKYPYTMDEEYRYEMIKMVEKSVPQDNTYVNQNRYVPVPVKVTPKPIVAKPNTSNQPVFDQKISKLMMTFQPYVQGQDLTEANTQAKNDVHVKWVNLEAEKYRSKTAYRSANQVFYHLFRSMGLDMYNLEKGTYTKTGNFAKSIQAQEYLANQSIALFEQAAPLIKNEIFHGTKTETYTVTGNINSPRYGTLETRTVNIYKTALQSMAYKAYNAETDAIDNSAISTIIGKAITAAYKSLQGVAHDNTPATPLKESLLTTFANSNPTDYVNDKRFKFMYDNLEQLRQIMIYNGGQPQAVTEKMEKLDELLYKKIHPWKWTYEHYIEPIVNVAMAIMMVVSFVVGIVFPPAAIPAWIAATLFVFEVSSFVFTMTSSVGYRIMYQRMYEIPATLKMQTHLAAISSIGDSPIKLMYESASGLKTYGMSTPLDDFDRIKKAEQANIDERRSMIYERLFWLPLDMMWGASILKMGKNLTGLSTVKALKKMGLPTLTFKDKIKVIFKTEDWKKYIQEKGLVRGIATVGKDVGAGLTEVNKLLPKYQPYSKQLLEQHGLRIGLFNKLDHVTQTQYLGKTIIGDAKYALTGENITIYNLFKDIKAHDEKIFKQFISMQEHSDVAKLASKIEEMVNKGITPAEIIGKYPKAPKTIFGVFFSGMTEKSRLNQLKTILKEDVAVADALEKYRYLQARKALGQTIERDIQELNALLGEGYEFSKFENIFEKAMWKTNLSNAQKIFKENLSVWKASKTDEVKLTNLMLKYQTAINEAKHVKTKNLVDKCTDIETMLEKNPEFFKEKGFSSAIDYWLSTLDHSDLMLIEEVAKNSKKGTTARNLKEVYSDFRTVMETIQPLKYKQAAENFKPSTDIIPSSTFENDYYEIIVEDANLYPNDGFGMKKDQKLLGLEGEIEASF